MLKYVDTLVGFSEVPDEISLCINISGCKNNCKGCHSAYLKEDVGQPLTKTVIYKLIEENKGITCVCFMGGDHLSHRILELGARVKSVYPNLKVAWYSGKDKLPEGLLAWMFIFDYIKIGSYKEEMGPLTNPNTNQKFYRVIHSEDSDNSLEDITYKFQKL